MLKKFTVAVLLLMFMLTGIGWGQWSQDPSEALNLPDIPHGYVLTTDSLGGVFIVGTGQDYSRTYCTYIDRGGELGWDRWISFIPEADIDYPTGVIVCPEPGYIVALQLTEHRSDEDTTSGFRAQKLDREGQRLWSDFGVPVSNLNLQLEGIARLEVIGVVSDGERGLIILWVIKYWRLMGQGDFILERQSFRAQRLSLDGEALWGDDGVEVITDVNGRDGISGKTVSDGAGGVIMVYHKGGIDVRIIGGQRISPEGETLWGDSGVSYELNSYLFIGDAVSDNQGGVIFSGQAAQNERRQVRVFRLDQDGD